MYIIQAYRRNLTLPRYLFMTIGWYTRFWWREIPDEDCTVEQRESVLQSTIAVSDEVFLDPVEDVNITTSLGMVGNYIVPDPFFKTTIELPWFHGIFE